MILAAALLGSAAAWILTEGWISGFTAAILFFILAILLAFGEWTTCILDRDRRRVTLQRTRIWRNSIEEIPYDDIHTLSVQRTRGLEDGVPTYRVLFALNSGRTIPLSNSYSGGRHGKERLAARIIAYLNQDRSTPVHAAPEGLVRVRHSGETDGVHWQIFFVTSNDQVPLTRWETQDHRFKGGFLLFVPAATGSTRRLPAGMLGSAVRLLYGQYLRMLDLKEQDLPGFERAEVLSGQSVGLDRRFSVLSSHPAAAREWLNPQRTGRLNAWTRANPLQARRGAAVPHLLASVQGLQLVFQGSFHRRDQVEEIVRFGAFLSQD